MKAGPVLRALSHIGKRHDGDESAGVDQPDIYGQVVLPEWRHAAPPEAKEVAPNGAAAPSQSGTLIRLLLEVVDPERAFDVRSLKRR